MNQVIKKYVLRSLKLKLIIKSINTIREQNFNQLCVARAVIQTAS